MKKGWPRTKAGLAEKDVKSNWWQMPPSFDRFESFGHDELTAKHYYFRCSRLPDVYGIKIFDKDDQAATILSILTFCGLVIFIKNFDPINIRRSWASEITIFCGEFIMTKTFKPIKTRRHWQLIWFHIFFSKACCSSWPPFLHLGCFWLDFTYFLIPQG